MKSGDFDMTFKVLLPSDGSPAATHAARYAARNLQGRDASVLLLNVQPVYVDAEMLHMGRAIVEIHRNDGEAALREAAGILAAAGIEHRAEIAFGPVAQAIAHAAKHAGSDAIVMGTRARHPAVELFARSTPSRVLRHAEVPVMLVRYEPKRSAERPAAVETPFIAA